MVNRVIDKREINDRLIEQRKQMRKNRIRNEIYQLRKSYYIEYDDYNTSLDEIIVNGYTISKKQPIYRSVICFPEYYPWKPFECYLEIDIQQMLRLYNIPLWEVLSEKLTYDVVETIIKKMVETTPPTRTPFRSVLNWCDTDHFVDVYTEAYYENWTPVMCVKPMLEIFTKKLVI